MDGSEVIPVVTEDTVATSRLESVFVRVVQVLVFPVATPVWLDRSGRRSGGVRDQPREGPRASLRGLGRASPGPAAELAA